MADKAKGGGEAPKRWWQWFLLYPTLAVSLLGYSPTVLDFANSLIRGIPYAGYKDSLLNEKMFQKNLDCLADKKIPVLRSKTPNGSTIDLRVCRSGDVLIKFNAGEGTSFTSGFRWVEMDAFKKVAHLDFRFNSFLYAQEIQIRTPEQKELQKSIPTCLCKWVIDSTHIALKYRNGGRCYIEVMNILTGNIEETFIDFHCTQPCSGKIFSR